MSHRGSSTWWTAAAMLAFAANSLLCRFALVRTSMDAAAFTAVRLGTGALVLAALVGFRPARLRAERASWGSALALFVYAAAFSLAYVHLNAGLGALLLFGAVQLTMLGSALSRGERLGRLGWIGAGLALLGLLTLTLPAASAGAALLPALQMTAAGVAWGVYSLRGRGAGDPLGVSAGNFIRTLPGAAALWLLSSTRGSLPWQGVVLAALSGGVASGLGYAIWYRALRDLSASQAAIVQLSVPVLAAALGIVLLGEPFTARLAVAGLVTLLGIALFHVAPRPEVR